MYIFSYLSGLAAVVKVIIVMKDSNASDVKPLLETVLCEMVEKGMCDLLQN
jgi:hypothetical protein